ncbi:hypothetical protein ATI61_104138 [Archangium gephyra]|uniref:Uncharacterized protein n=2 Tax=Archangium gephyra TaxID=48 RepID=A0ABX9K3T4_9BACT|nr:hypothetical protein ATI61_104138 [Archangium gephyra]
MPSSGDAYLYGRFFMKRTIDTLYGTHGSMGLDFACQNNNKTYTIGFAVEDPVQVIRIPGGDVCSLVSITYSDSVGGWAGTDPVPSKALSRAIHFEAGKAYYLGDFVGSFGYAGVNTLRWEVTDVRDDFLKTTREMKSIFHNLSAIPTENKTML